MDNRRLRAAVCAGLLAGLLSPPFLPQSHASPPTTCSPTGSNGTFLISSNCSFAGTVDGVDYASGGTGTNPNKSILEIAAGISVRLETASLQPQTLSVGQLKLNTGSSLIIPNGSQLTMGQAIFARDTDGDGYMDTSNVVVQRAMTYAGYIRRISASGTDLNDAQRCADADLPTTVGGALYGTTCKKCLGGAVVNQAANVDTYNQCAALTCTNYAWGWGGTGSLTCLQAANNATTNGMCNGTGACNTTAATACQAGATGTAVGSAGCKNACATGDTWTGRDTVAEVGYTDNTQHGCASNYKCNASATCVSAGLHCWGTIAGSCNGSCSDDGTGGYYAGECSYYCAGGNGCSGDGSGSCFTLTTGTYNSCSLYDQYYPYDCMACDGSPAGSCSITGVRCVWNP
jgi:hypothetical protein